MIGPLSRFFVEDHRRLDALLKRACQSAEIDTDAYEGFRAGILRHIGMEERILVPAAQRALGGQALPVARLLRLDHGAIASLLVPTPSARIIEKIAATLGPHNEAEERADGLYAVCDELLVNESEALIQTLRAFPPIPLAPHQDGPNVHRHIEETLELARRAWADEVAAEGSRAPEPRRG